jgi:DNA-3-methyladenine glycosylase I
MSVRLIRVAAMDAQVSRKRQAKADAPLGVEPAAPRHVVAKGLAVGEDGRARCSWADSTADYRAYHDDEWGRPVRSDDGIYERLTLEAFQSGLSWITILRKRPAFRAAFADFSIAAVAKFDERDAARLLADVGIVRNRAKIDAAMANARAALDLPDGLAAFLWAYAPDPAGRRRPRSGEVPATTPESTAMAKDLRKHGFRFVGPTTAYALMQATGMVDDHIDGCFVPPVVERRPARTSSRVVKPDAASSRSAPGKSSAGRRSA